MLLHRGGGEILRHHADEKGRVDVRDHPHRARRVFRSTRQDQVADDHALFHHPPFVEDILGSLPAHLFQGDARAFGIVPRSAVFYGERAVGIFEIGQPDIDDVLEPAQDHDILRAVPVPHNGQFRACFEHFKYGNEPFSPRIGGDEVDVFRPLFFEAQEEGEQFLAVHVHPFAAV